MKEIKSRLLAIWHKRWVKTLLIIVVVLTVIRLILPPVATLIANEYLGKYVPGYYGHVDAVHFALLRGAYQVEGMSLDKIDSATYVETEFMTVKMIDLSVEWGALLHGKLAGEMFYDSPVINFTKDKVMPSEVVKDTATFRQMLDLGMPLDINRFEVVDGQVHYKDPNATPALDIYMHDLYVLAENLKNTVDPGQKLPASVEMRANVYGGNVGIQVDLDLLADAPTFDLRAEVKELNLPELNSFFKAYGKFTVEEGNFSVYSEMAAKDGLFKGYIKPLMVGLRVLGPNDKNENVLVLLWEGIIDAVNWVFKNKKQDQLATKIPLDGRFDDPKVNIGTAIYELLKNGFIEALSTSLDYEINIRSVAAEDTRTLGEKLKDKTTERKEKNAIRKKEKEQKK